MSALVWASTLRWVSDSNLNESVYHLVSLEFCYCLLSSSTNFKTRRFKYYWLMQCTNNIIAICSSKVLRGYQKRAKHLYYILFLCFSGSLCFDQQLLLSMKSLECSSFLHLLRCLLFLNEMSLSLYKPLHSSLCLTQFQLCPLQFILHSNRDIQIMPT